MPWKYLIWIPFGENVQSYFLNNGVRTKIYLRKKNFYNLHVHQIFCMLKWLKGSRWFSKCSLVNFLLDEPCLILEKYLAHGSLANRGKGSGTGPKIPVKTPENLQKVKIAVEQDWKKPYDQIANSARRNKLNLSRTYWSRSVKDLGLNCYR